MSDAQSARAARRAGESRSDARSRAKAAVARVRQVVEDVVRCFADRDLLSYASAIAFQVLYAIPPCLLAAVALLGFLGLEEAWTEELRPQVRETMPADAFAILDRTVQTILDDRRTYWLTFGLAFTIWQLSSAIRAASGALQLVYGARSDDRGIVRRILASLAIAVAIAPLLLLAVLALSVGDDVLRALEVPSVAGVLLAVVRYGGSIAALLAVVYLVLRFGPAREAGAGRISLGALVVVAGWLGSGAIFGFYVTEIASYTSVFGALATVIVLMSFLYLLSVVFLVGAQVDAVVRGRARSRQDT